MRVAVDPYALLTMPNYYPEGDTAASQDNELRALQKWASEWYALKGNVACQFPEGTEPKPDDNEVRLLQKIEIMKNS